MNNVSMNYSGHNMDVFLNENDLGYIDNMEMEITDLINDFITDEALDDFGYKYGTTNYRRTASNVIRYIQTHLNELY